VTFLELQDAVMNALNLQSTEARTRIKARINQRYRQVQSTLNLERTRRSGGTVATVSGTATAIVSGTAKILGLYDGDVRHQVLEEVTRAAILQQEAASAEVGVPRMWAVDQHIADVVVARFFPTPNAVYTLDMDRLAAGTELTADDDEPTTPVDFHDVFVDGVMADEYLKLENEAAARRFEARFERRLAELRYFLVKSAYLKGSVRGGAQTTLPGTVTWPFTNGF
jgi:hypothetical protein